MKIMIFTLNTNWIFFSNNFYYRTNLIKLKSNFTKNKFLNSLIITSIFLNLYFFIVLIIDFIDTGNFFAKFYLYRPARMDYFFS